MYLDDPEKYPLNPATRLAKGDLHRIAVIFGIFAVIGLIGSLWWFKWYEVGWESYYEEAYAYMKFLGTTGEEIAARIYDIMLVLSAAYGVVGIAIKIIGKKIDTKDTWV